MSEPMTGRVLTDWTPWRPSSAERARGQQRAKTALTKMFPDEYRALYLAAMEQIRDETTPASTPSEGST